MSLFESLIMSSFYYSCLAYINMPNFSWDRIEVFLVRSLKQIFELPMNMNSAHAREIFRTTTFRESIENFARRRIVGLSNSSSLTQDLIADFRDYSGMNGKDTILERLLKTAGLDPISSCHMCSFNVDHDCVK